MYDPLCGILYNGWLIKAVLCTILCGILYNGWLIKAVVCTILYVGFYIMAG